MGQLRVLKGGWGVMGRPEFKENDLIDEESLPPGVSEAAVQGKKAERVPTTSPAKPAGGTP